MSIDTRETQRLGSGGALGDTFYPAYQWAFDEEGEFVKSVEKKLGQARMADNVEMFLARAMAVGTLSGVALWLVGTLVGYLAVTMLFAGATDAPTFLGLTGLPEGVVAVINAVKIPFLIVVTGVVFGAIGFGIGFGSLVSIPYFRASARKREVNVLLSDAISFMYALSVGGLNQLEILQAMAKADDTYGECAKEFQSIVLETGTSTRTTGRPSATRPWRPPQVN